MPSKNLHDFKLKMIKLNNIFFSTRAINYKKDLKIASNQLAYFHERLELSMLLQLTLIYKAVLCILCFM